MEPWEAMMFGNKRDKQWELERKRMAARELG
jgi:hypothetical protein